MLTNPRAALAEQNTVATALAGLAGLARTIRALAAAGRGSGRPDPADDDLVHLLLAVVSLSECVHRLAAPVSTAEPTDQPPPPAGPDEWLR